MITLKNVKTLDGQIYTHQVDSAIDQVIDGKGNLTLMPALIDPHVHFRTPGAEQKENWESGAQAAIAGGVATVFDMPNNDPACNTREAMLAKMKQIDQQLAKIGIPLRYKLYFGVDEKHVEEISFVKDLLVGIKIYMGSSTGNLVMENEKALDRAFQLAAQEDLIISVHAEDEKILKKQQALYANQSDPAVHSKIRDRSAAIKATEQAIGLTEKYGGQLFVLHVSTKEEMDLIRQAKSRELLVYAEVTPHHLFLTEKDYAQWGTLVQMNPPLRTQADQEALWEGIHDGTVDTIGSDHAPHLLQEKNLPYGQAPSGVPGIETTLPLLLNAYHEEKISLEKIISLTRFNIQDIFRLEPNSDVILIDLEKSQTVQNNLLKTKCGWSPFAGRTLKGWPVYTIVQGKVFPCT